MSDDNLLTAILASKDNPNCADSVLLARGGFPSFSLPLFSNLVERNGVSFSFNFVNLVQWSSDKK